MYKIVLMLFTALLPFQASAFENLSHGPGQDKKSKVEDETAFFSAYANTIISSRNIIDPPFFVVPLSNVKFSSTSDFLIDTLPVSRITIVHPGTYFVTFGGSLNGNAGLLKLIPNIPQQTTVLALANSAGFIKGGLIDLTSDFPPGNLVSTSVILTTTKPNEFLQLETFSFNGNVLFPDNASLAPTGDNSNSAFISIFRIQ